MYCIEIEEFLKMKSFIFSKKFEDIFTKERLHFVLSQLKPTPDDMVEVYEEIERGHFFDKTPKQSFLIPKDNGEYREIVLSSTKTKIIQKILSDELSAVLHFSDRSYAFRKGKSPLKAINRVKHLLNAGFNYVAKADIKGFFDSIDQEILIDKLTRIIEDKKIIYLIAYHLKQGFLRKNHWIDKTEGIYQGDVLSPLLSNIYLDAFDRFLERKGVEFLRYSDDLLFLAKSKDEASKFRYIARGYLKRLKLDFNMNKTYISTVDNGFEYLGIFFKGEDLKIDNKKLNKKLTALRHDLKNLDLKESIEKLNQKVDGYLNYYGKIGVDESGAKELQSLSDEILIEKIAEAKESKKITTKAKFKELLINCKRFVGESSTKWIEDLIDRSYKNLESKKPLESAVKRVEQNKRDFFKNKLKNSELVVSKPGSFLGFSRGKVTLKQEGKIVANIPINRLTRIMILNSKSTISVYLIKECSKRGIDIDFLEKGNSFALITYYQHIAPQLHLEQLKLYFSPRGLEIAKAIIKAKAANQLNLLKYYNRRKKDDFLQKKIETMQELFKKIENAKDKQALMGIEGNISTHYWKAFGVLLGVDDFVRTHKDSTETINQALNYGYAILYNRVQSTLLHNGFNLHYPLLHSVQNNKPTLVYDMVEEFRQAVVDREIISIINHNVKLTQTNGRLSEKSVKTITQHIQTRLSTITKSRYGKTTLLNIISNQILQLKHTIKEGDRKSVV